MKHSQFHLKRIWIRFTPLIQTWGWLSIFIPLCFLVYFLSPKVDASAATNLIQDEQITELQRNFSVINAKLDTAIYLLRRR